MYYGVGNLGIVPLRAIPNHKSEMVSQLLYGEHFTITEQLKNWSKICVAYDNYEGWIDNKQFFPLEKETYDMFDSATISLSGDLIGSVYEINNPNIAMPVPLGCTVSTCSFLAHRYNGVPRTGKQNAKTIIATALLYLNAPYLWGGKTPFGIDCSGFTQMVYKINGYTLFRDAAQQAVQGTTIDFIEECHVGDLAFFDNSDGDITHVGIIMEDQHIIHAHGKVRIDRVDHTGIFNVDTKTYSHNLSVLKKIN